MRARVTMLNLVFLFTLLGSSLFGSLIAAAAPGQWAAGRTDEPLVGGDRRIVLVVPEGQGDGELYYRRTHPSSSGIEGPSAFVVSEDGIYVLDKDNQRIVIWEGNECRNIDLGDSCFGPMNMKVQNGKIAVTSTNDKWTKIFSTDGELLHEFEHGKSSKEFFPYEIYDNVIVLCMGNIYCLRYNWETGQTNTYAYPERIITEEVSSTMGRMVRVQKKETGQEWMVPFSRALYIGIGACGEELYYIVLNSGAGIIRPLHYTKQYTDGRVWTAAPKMKNRAWGASVLYLAEDGRLYVLERFEGYVVISEILFDTYSRYQSENAAVQWPVSRSLEIQEAKRCRME